MENQILKNFQVGKMPANAEFMAQAQLQFRGFYKEVFGKSVVSEGRATARMLQAAAREMYDLFPPLD